MEDLDSWAYADDGLPRARRNYEEDLLDLVQVVPRLMRAMEFELEDAAERLSAQGRCLADYRSDPDLALELAAPLRVTFGEWAEGPVNWEWVSEEALRRFYRG